MMQKFAASSVNSQLYTVSATCPTAPNDKIDMRTACVPYVFQKSWRRWTNKCVDGSLSACASRIHGCKYPTRYQRCFPEMRTNGFLRICADTVEKFFSRHCHSARKYRSYWECRDTHDSLERYVAASSFRCMYEQRIGCTRMIVLLYGYPSNILPLLSPLLRATLANMIFAMNDIGTA